jgi:3-deoxy-D-manno-octulosonate 8-phosphate phosphatase (KDO 8-P phosphatase)
MTGMGQEEPGHAKLAARCQSIELLVVDVDGVMTDGVIAIDDDGRELKHFSVRDGLGFSIWHRAGKQSAILSGRRTKAVDRRAAELRIGHVLQGHDQKFGPFQELIGSLGLCPAQVCYVGDDLPDLPVLRVAGLSACPSDAVTQVKETAHLVTKAQGGRGVVREVIEHILEAQGSWGGLIAASPEQTVPIGREPAATV